MGKFLLNTGGPHTLNHLAQRRRTDYTDEGPISLVTGKRYEVLIYQIMPREHHSDARVTLFIDYNNNRKYDLPEERVGTWFTSINDYLITDSIMIPDSVITGVETGVRVILNNNVGPNPPSDEACGEYPSGETEDFMVVFRREFPHGVEELPSLTGLQVYPNPGSGLYYLSFEAPAPSSVKWTVKSAAGQVVKTGETKVETKQARESIDISGFAPGVYILELAVEGQRLHHRLILR